MMVCDGTIIHVKGDADAHVELYLAWIMHMAYGGSMNTWNRLLATFDGPLI